MQLHIFQHTENEYNLVVVILVVILQSSMAIHPVAMQLKFLVP